MSDYEERSAREAAYRLQDPNGTSSNADIERIVEIEMLAEAIEGPCVRFDDMRDWFRRIVALL